MHSNVAILLKECKSSCGHVLWPGVTGDFMEDTPYLTHSSEIWGVDCEWIGKYRSRCIGTILLYHALYIAHKKTPRSWGQVEADVGSTKPRHDETRYANIERTSYSNHTDGPELVQAHLNSIHLPGSLPRHRVSICLQQCQWSNISGNR